jgi:hypothetical protein
VGRKGLEMTINKDGKEYAFAERKECWVVSRNIGALTVEYKVPKDVCTTEAELREYVEREEIF